jgi:hypothetical protein
VPISGDIRLAPTSLNAIEFQEVSGGSRTALELVYMDDLKAIVLAGIVIRPFGGTERRAQR